MLEGAFSFRGRIGRLNFFLAGLLMIPAAFVAALVMMALMAGAQRSTASLVFFAIVGGLMAIAAFWYSLSLHVRRIRDIGWDPFVVIVGWLVIGGLDVVLAKSVPSLAIGHGHTGTAFGALFNLALSLILLFWPGRGDSADDIAAVFGDTPRPSRLDALVGGASGLAPAGAPAPMPAGMPSRPAVRKEFGRRGVK